MQQFFRVFRSHEPKNVVNELARVISPGPRWRAWRLRAYIMCHFITNLTKVNLINAGLYPCFSRAVFFSIADQQIGRLPSVIQDFMSHVFSWEKYVNYFFQFRGGALLLRSWTGLLRTRPWFCSFYNVNVGKTILLFFLEFDPPMGHMRRTVQRIYYNSHRSVPVNVLFFSRTEAVRVIVWPQAQLAQWIAIIPGMKSSAWTVLDKPREGGVAKTNEITKYPDGGLGYAVANIWCKGRSVKS